MPCSAPLDGLPHLLRCLLERWPVSSQVCRVTLLQGCHDRLESGIIRRDAISDGRKLAPCSQPGIRSNPFPEAASEPKSLHFCFLASSPRSPDIDALTAAQTRTERFRLIGQVLYLHTPDGIGRSKLAATVEKALGVTVTARNWRTVDSLREMLSSQ